MIHPAAGSLASIRRRFSIGRRTSIPGLAPLPNLADLHFEDDLIRIGKGAAQKDLADPEAKLALHAREDRAEDRAPKRDHRKGQRLEGETRRNDPQAGDSHQVAADVTR